MARCSVAKPFCATTAAPCLSRRCRQLSANATTPAMSTSKAGLPALSKPAKPPPPLLLSRPKLPVATTTATDTTSGKDCTKKPPPPEATDSYPSSSGAGDVLRLMDALGIPPDEDIYISLLRECADAAEVASVHAHMTARCRFGGLPSPVANRVLLSYAACGDIEAARRVFDEMSARNGMAWATMVSAYSDGCFHREAMRLFAHMCHGMLVLDGDCCSLAIVAVLRSCTRAGELRLGEQVHALIVKKGRVHSDIGSSLVQLYCESGGLHRSARRVLMAMLQHHCEEPIPEAAWTSLITSCHRDGQLNEAIDVFKDMTSSGIPRSSFSLSSILAVFAESQNQGCCGQQVHADAIKRGMDTNQFVGSGLVHMYAKQGRLADAARAFEAIGGKPDAVCWNALAMAYARSGRYREATRVMYQMKAAGVVPSQEMADAIRLACFR